MCTSASHFLSDARTRLESKNKTSFRLPWVMQTFPLLVRLIFWRSMCIFGIILPTIFTQWGSSKLCSNYEQLTITCFDCFHNCSLILPLIASCSTTSPIATRWPPKLAQFASASSQFFFFWWYEDNRIQQMARKYNQGDRLIMKGNRQCSYLNGLFMGVKIHTFLFKLWGFLILRISIYL